MPDRQASCAEAELEAAALPYVVRLWSADGSAAERVIATVADASSAYACFYSVARCFPGRRLTLSLGEQAVSDIQL